ncbi:MAG: FAD-dependent oxidoreductase [Proteobacteria bacterium]|nr:FAD-dependent oxidoreductase [Pseudomonadota bacterium]
MTAAESIVIVGAGQAGGWVAATLRNEGFTGRVVLVGEESYAPYERPPLSKSLLAGERPIEKCYIRPPVFYTERDVDLRLGTRVEEIDTVRRRIALSDGERLAYDKLVFATGARVRRLKLPGAELPGLHYLRTIDDCLAIRAALKPGARVVLVGGGYIGLEVAATARKLGCAVVIVEMQRMVMARIVPEGISRYLAELHRGHGVEILTEVGVAGFERGSPLRVCCDGGRNFDADLVVVGVGIEPNVELARAAGIATEDGVVVDEFGRSAVPGIYAAGDVARHFNPLLGRHIRLESWQNAQNQAIAVARGLCGKPVAYGEVPWFWSDQFDLKIQIVGLPERWGEVVLRGDMAANRFTAFSLADGIVNAAIAVNTPLDIRFARKFIAERQRLAPSALADPQIPLKTLG